jgi:hypothetical protein
MSFSSSRFFVPGGGGAAEEDANDEADDEADEEADDEADDEVDDEADDEVDGEADDEASVVGRVGGAMENRRGFDVEARAKREREVDVSAVTSLPLEDGGGRLNRDIRGRSDAGL